MQSNSYVPLTSHPRILLHVGEEANVKKVIDSMPQIKAVNDSIFRVCDRMIKWPLLKRKIIGVRMLNVSRDALMRIFYLSYGYRLTGEKKYADRALKEILNVCNFIDWHPSHFLDVGEMTMAVGIGYDWLYDMIDEDNRKFIRQSIRDKALKIALNSRYSSYLKRSDNWNSVCNAGLIYGAIAVMDEFPVEATEVLDQCIKYNAKVLETYAPDGVYPEGYSYWSYGTTSEVLLIDALKTAFGSDFGLSSYSGFMETGSFMQYMTTPTGGCFNFSDSWGVALGNITSWWFAVNNNDASLLYQELKYLKSGNIKISESRLLPALPIFASRVGDMKAVPPQKNFWIGDGVTPVFIYRSGWDSNKDTYLGIKGGKPSTAHGHMDAGSFVYEFNGVRWATDLGRPDYNFIEQRGVRLWDTSQDSDRWSIIRMRNDYHNTLTINDCRHQVKGNGRIIETYVSSGKKGAIVDLTSTLGKCIKAYREVSLDENDYLNVVDNIVSGDDDIDLMWVMVTPTEAKIQEDNTIVLTDGQKNMKFNVESPLGYSIYIWPIIPIHDYDQPSPGKIRIGYKTHIPANTHTTLKVTLKPMK